MIKFTYNLKWNGPIIISNVEREVKRAVRQGAERVRRAAKDPLLNVSGKAPTALAGLNKKWSQKRRIRTPNGIGVVPGAFRFTSRFNQSRTYRIDRVYWYGGDLRRYVQSSPPGKPPHKQQGHLQRSVAVETINNGMRAKIGPGNGLKYARIQELGGRTRFGTLPPRPYMGPALQMTQSAILQDFYKAVARATS